MLARSGYKMLLHFGSKNNVSFNLIFCHRGNDRLLKFVFESMKTGF